MKKENTIVTSLRFPYVIYEEIRGIARQQHRTISQQIVYFCEQFMKIVEEQESKEKVASE